MLYDPVWLKRELKKAKSTMWFNDDEEKEGYIRELNFQIKRRR